MKCPRCGSDVRPSKKTPGYYLCDTCRKRYPASAVIDDSHDDFFDTDDLDIDFDADSRETPGQNASSRSSDSSRRNPARSSTKAAPVKKKKDGIFKVLLIFLLLLLIAGGIVFGLVHFHIIANPLDKVKESGTTQQADKGTDKSDPLTTYQVGETAEYNGIKVTALGYEESSGDDWSAPAEGNVFVFVNMEITNNTDEELPVSSMASFENYCGEEKLDYSANAFTALATNTDRKQMDGSIASGDTLNGYLCLEVPSDWTTLTIHYANNVWSNDKVQFEIKK